MTMKNTMAALAIAAVAGTMMFGAAGDAEAGGKKRFRFNHFHHHKVWNHDFYGAKCYHLKKKAKITGNPFLWKKYKKCMAIYYW